MTVKLRYKLVIQTNSQKVIKEMYPNETAEHHRDHRCRNKEVNQFCYDPISKYRGNFCGCITRHHPVWAGSRSWVSRHLSLHIRMRGDEVRVRSCLIFRYRTWPKKQCILEKHSNLLQKYNSCRLLLTITHKYLSSHETRKHRHIFARVAAFWQRVFQTLPNLDVHPGVAVYHTLKIFSSVNAKDLLMPHTEFQVCTLKINTIFRHRKKKILLLLNRSVYNLFPAIFIHWKQIEVDLKRQFHFNSPRSGFNLPVVQYTKWESVIYSWYEKYGMLWYHSSKPH